MMSNAIEIRQAFETPQWYFEKLNYRVKLRKEIVFQFTQKLGFDRYIDIGCGDGSISIPLLNNKRHLTLQDISSAMLKRARSYVPTELLANVDLIEGDFRSHALEPASYDLVICLGVLAYVSDVPAFINRMSALLRPGGFAIFECTDCRHFLSRFLAAYSALTALVRRPKTNVPLCAHAGSDVVACFSKSGYEQAGRYSYSTPLPIIRSLMNQETRYRMISRLHGTAERNRARWLGSEHIFLWRKSGNGPSKNHP